MRFSRQFRTPDYIVQRVSCVWVMNFIAYFNCCHFFLNIPNYRPPLGEYLIFMSSKGDPLDAQVEFFTSSHREGFSIRFSIFPLLNEGVRFPMRCSLSFENHITNM